MAQASSSPAASDRDLTSIHEARTLARQAKAALARLAELSQEQIDHIVDQMAAAAAREAEPLARLAVEETGYGVVADKVQKNLFSAEQVYRFIRPLKTVGVIRRLEDRKVVEIAEPFGVVAAIVPSTNPTSTAIYKILISVKARCPIVLSPHPAAVRCISRSAEIMWNAAQAAGAPEGTVGWMNTVTLEGTQELMRHRDVAVILATGGMGLVRAAYSAGKPAYGVGPGNAPAYIERTADIPKAVRDVVTGKTFDNGVLCSAENAVVTEEAIADQIRQEFEAQGGYFMSPEEIDKVGTALVSPQRLPNPALVGRSATYIAQQAGISVPPTTRVLLAPLAGVGRDYPLSIEKLCPVLAFYVVRDWREACERSIEILRYGGMGHTMAIHSKNEEVILQFGLKKPAFRIVVNTPTTHGSIGLSTGLDPAMTLGCGGYGGNITSDNITPMHLLNIKRLAYETRPVQATGRQPAEAERRTGAAGARPSPVAQTVVSGGINAESLARRVGEFLERRGFRPTQSSSAPRSGPAGPPPQPPAGNPSARATDFVSEADVRQAVKNGTKIVVDERTIITPAARDLGSEKNVFVQAGWPR